jgi:hypothetical protein
VGGFAAHAVSRGAAFVPDDITANDHRVGRICPPYQINTILKNRRIMTFLHGLAPIDTSKRQLFD